MSKLDHIIKPATDKKLLIVIPHHPDKYGDIKIAIAAWQKFCTFDYELVVIGDYDRELESIFTDVTFIYCDRASTVKNQYMPHIDLANKYSLIMSKYDSIYDGFVRLADDHYAVKNFVLDDILTTHYHQPSFTGDKSKPTSYWKHDIWKTRQLLDKEKLPHVNYTTHFPFYVEFCKTKELCDKYNLTHNSYCFESLYFNYYSHEEPVIDSDIRYAICNREDSLRANIQNAINNTSIKFLFSSNDGWSEYLHKQLKELIQ